MKKIAFALAVLPAAVAVQAQSNVTLYGRVDMGVEHVTHASAAGDSITRATSGNMNTSRWGLLGSEDLGGGLKAVFQLEGGFFADTGAQDGNLFGRQANVGLDGAFGRLVAGRSYTVVYDFMLPFDPMGYSANYSWVTSGNGSLANKFGMATAFDNQLKYAKKFGNGLSVGASYGFGEQTTGIADSARYALALGYATGPFSAALTHEQVNGNKNGAGDRNETTASHVGLGFAVTKAVSLKAGFRRYELDNVATADLRADTAWLGVNWQAAPAVGLTAAVYHQDVKNVAADADPTMYVLRAKYALSKRTDLYAAAAYAEAKNNQVVSLSRNASPEGVAGFADTQTGVTFGVQHRF